MATKTIHTLAYKILVDTEKFSKGMKTTKTELASAKREMRAMLTPAEKMELSLNKLGQLAQKDARFQGLYNRKLHEYNRELRKSTVAGKAMALATSSIGKAFIGFAAGTSAIMLFRRGLTGAINQIEKLSALSKTADSLGITVEHLTRLGAVAEDVSQIKGEGFAKALQTMLRTVAEARTRGGTKADIFAELGLDLDSLSGKAPEEIFNAIARSMDKVTNAQDRLQIAGEIFGARQAKIQSTLALTDDKMKELGASVTRLGDTVSDKMAEDARVAQLALDDLYTALDKLARVAAMEFAPAIRDAALAIAELVTAVPKAWTVMQAVGIGVLETRYGDPRSSSLMGNIAAAAGGLVTQQHIDRHAASSKASTRAESQRQSMEQAESQKKANKTVADDQKRKDEDRNKMLREALRLTESVRTAEEKHAATLAEINLMHRFGNVSSETAKRLATKADNELKGDLISRINAGTADDPKSIKGFERVTEGPRSSIAAGSSEAFAALNQTTVTREVDIAVKQLDYAKQSLDELKKIAAALPTSATGIE